MIYDLREILNHILFKPDLPSLSAVSLFSAVALLLLVVGVEVTIAAGVVTIVVCLVGLLVKIGGLRFGPLVVVEDEPVVVVLDVGPALGRLVVVAEGLLDFRAVVDLTSKVVSSSLCWNTISWRLGCSLKLCGV
jgi:hypothetical protein